MIEWMASKTALTIKTTVPDRTASLEVLNYGFILLFNTVIIIAISLLYGVISSQLLEISVALFSFALIRFFSGGKHVENTDDCVFISIALMIIIVTLSPMIVSLFTMLNLITLYLMLIYSPSNIQLNPKRWLSNKLYLLKIISVIMVLFNFLVIKSDVVMVSFFIQALSLIEHEGAKKHELFNFYPTVHN
jgi:accessory gene regulator B